MPGLVKKTMTVIDYRRIETYKLGNYEQRFIVDSMQNTVRHEIGEEISIEQVKNLIAEDFTINVKRPK